MTPELRDALARIRALERAIENFPLKSKGGGAVQAYQIIDNIEGPDDIGPDTGIVLADSVVYDAAGISEVPSTSPQTYGHGSVMVEGLGIGQIRGSFEYVWVAQKIIAPGPVTVQGIAVDIPNGASVFTSGPILIPVTGGGGALYPCYLAWQM